MDKPQSNRVFNSYLRSKLADSVKLLTGVQDLFDSVTNSFIYSHNLNSHCCRKILASTEIILSNKTKKRVPKVGVEYVCYCGRGST